MQTQTSNTLHNAIMEAGSKDRPPMLAPGNYIQWKSRIKRYIDTKPNQELIHYCLENPPYELGWKEKAEFGKFTSLDGESLESYYSRFYKMMNELTRNQCKVTNHQVNVQFLLQVQPEWQRETVGSSIVQKSGIQCYNCKEFGHIARECQKPKRAKDAAYHREKMLLCKQEEAGIQLNAEQADWKDDTDDESDDQELEAHYMYMAKIQEVSPDAVDSGPIFDTEPELKVQNDDRYDVFAIECQHHEQSESVHITYLIEQDAHNVIIESKDMNYDSEQIDQNDEDADLAKERELLAS
nr:hypothetical protein [Tanacetum cinerariifolium]